MTVLALPLGLAPEVDVRDIGASPHSDIVRPPPHARLERTGADLPSEALAQVMGAMLSSTVGPAMRSSLAPVVSGLEGIRRQSEDGKSSSEGTLGYLRSQSR